MLPVSWIYDVISKGCDIPKDKIHIKANGSLPIRIFSIDFDTNVEVEQIESKLKQWFWPSRNLSVLYKEDSNELIIAFNDQWF